MAIDECSKCGSERWIVFEGTVLSSCVTMGDEVYNDDIPCNINIGEGDNLQFKVCADCGQMAGLWPNSESTTDENPDFMPNTIRCSHRTLDLMDAVEKDYPHIFSA